MEKDKFMRLYCHMTDEQKAFLNQYVCDLHSHVTQNVEKGETIPRGIICMILHELNSWMREYHESA